MTRATSLTVSVLLLSGLAASCDRSGVTDKDAAARMTPPGEAVPANAGSTTITALPLERGYYVASDTACRDSSNATVVLMQRDGMASSRDFCEFKEIEQTAPSTYRVTQACASFQDAAPPEIGIVTYTIPSATSFVSRDEHGWEHDARYCEQSDMSPDFRENDISEIAD